MQLRFDTDASGALTLSGHTFESTEFHDLEIVPRTDQQVCIEDCKFLNCFTRPGTCVIARGVSLENVTFLNLDCGDAIRISSEVSLKRVVIAGDKPNALIIQPEDRDRFAMRAGDHSEYQLDVAEFTGDVTIIGLHGNMVRKNPALHVTVKTQWRAEVDWKRLGIGPFSYWRILIKKLEVCNAMEGVFSLPNACDRHYAETMEEMALLATSGIQFA